MVARLSRECSELVDYQRGVIARWQAPDRAVDQPAVEALVRAGRWQTLYRGVYAAYTGPPSRDSTLWAAVLPCGPEAVLSHITAAELDGLTDRPGDVIHVTIPRQSRAWLSEAESRRRLPAIVVHRSGRLPEARHPARTPPRTRIEETSSTSPTWPRASTVHSAG